MSIFKKIGREQGKNQVQERYGAEAYRNRLDEVRAALWGMESEEHHGQGLYAENGQHELV